MVATKNTVNSSLIAYISTFVRYRYTKHTHQNVAAPGGEVVQPQRNRRPFDKLVMFPGDQQEFVDNVSIAITDAHEPKTIDEALDGANLIKW